MPNEKEKISEKKEDFTTAKIYIDNIISSVKIKRFEFTPEELTSLLFCSDLLSEHIKELNRY